MTKNTLTAWTAPSGGYPQFLNITQVSPLVAEISVRGNPVAGMCGSTSSATIPVDSLRLALIEALAALTVASEEEAARRFLPVTVGVEGEREPTPGELTAVSSGFLQAPGSEVGSEGLSNEEANKAE